MAGLLRRGTSEHDGMTILVKALVLRETNYAMRRPPHLDVQLACPIASMVIFSCNRS